MPNLKKTGAFRKNNDTSIPFKGMMGNNDIFIAITRRNEHDQFDVK